MSSTHVEPEVLAWLDEADGGVDAERLVRLSRPGPRYTSYPTAPVWNDEVGPADLERHLDLAEAEGQASPLSVYVHVPFCRTMCRYCGCNVVIARRPERADLYLAHLAREVELVASRLPTRRRVAQLHLGGGTPTFLSEAQLEDLWRILTGSFLVEPGAEVALEIDPVVTTADQLTLLRELGFGRVSMGIQDFTPEVQRAVGRVQTVERTRALFEHARALGYRGINVDLIYGLPLQRPETFDRTLREVIDMGPDRLAVFGYAHVPWMRPQQRAFDPATLPGPADRFRLFLLALRRLTEAGYVQIGMDHFARPDDELAGARLARRLRRNFQGYTVLPASDILAFGITAISEVQGLYAQNVKPLAHYYRAVADERLATERGRRMTGEDRLRRRVIHDIMCNYHVDLTAVGAEHGVDGTRHFAGELARLAPLEADGLVRRSGPVLELTPLGRILVRNVAMVFDAYLDKKSSNNAPRFSQTV